MQVFIGVKFSIKYKTKYLNLVLKNICNQTIKWVLLKHKFNNILF